MNYQRNTRRAKDKNRQYKLCDGAILSTSRLKGLSGEPPSCNNASTLFLLVNCFIFPNRPPSGQDTKHDGESTAGDDDASTHLVARLLRAQEEVRAEPMRDAGHTVGDGNECSALGARARHDRSLPRELNI
jgi:hypothetical protein